MFKNRKEAGEKLAFAIKNKYPKIDDGIVLGLPRGGIVLAKIVADILKLALDIVVTRKIGHPLSPEFAIGAVSLNELVLRAEEAIDVGYLSIEIERQRKEIRRRLESYRKSRARLDLKGKTVILVDDGLATGLTMEVAIKEVLLERPKKIIVAVPVATKDTVDKIKLLNVEVIVLQMPKIFLAVGQFYFEFEQVSDEEVIKLLNS